MMINGDDKSIDRVCSQIKAFLSALSALYDIAYIEEDSSSRIPIQSITPIISSITYLLQYRGKESFTQDKG